MVLGACLDRAGPGGSLLPVTFEAHGTPDVEGELRFLRFGQPGEDQQSRRENPYCASRGYGESPSAPREGARGRTVGRFISA